MVAAFLLQALGLIGFPVGGALVAGWGGAVLGGSVSAVYVGIAMEGR